MNIAKLFFTLLLVGGVVWVAMYCMRSKKQEEMAVVISTPAMNEEVQEVMMSEPVLVEQVEIEEIPAMAEEVK